MGVMATATVSTGLIIPYSPEYDLLSGDSEVFLKKLRKEADVC